MSVVLQLLAKASSQVDLFFDRVPGDVASVNIYVSLTEASGYHLVRGKVPNISARQESDLQIKLVLTLAEVQGAHASLAGATFTSTPLFLKATTVSAAGVESDIALSLVKPIGVVGVTRSVLGDNPMKSAFGMGLSHQARGWVATAQSSQGAVRVSMNPLEEDEIVIDRTIVGGNVTEELFYYAADPSGARAMKIVYTGPFATDGRATKEEYILATKP